jgi:hypothetical protein
VHFFILIMILITAFLNTDHELDQRIKLSLHEPFLIRDGGQYNLYNYLKIIKSKICHRNVCLTCRAMLMIRKCGSPNLEAIFCYITTKMAEDNFDRGLRRSTNNNVDL